MNQNEIERSLRIIGQLLCENVALREESVSLREENEALRAVGKQLSERVNAAEQRTPAEAQEESNGE